MLKEIIGRVIDDLRAHTGQTEPPYSTGLPSLDQLTWGFHRKELVILGGRPAMGKTSLALYFAWQLANANNKTVFFTLEMSREELVRRLLSQQCKIENTKIRRNNLNDEDFERIEFVKSIDIPLYIEESGFRIEDIEAYVRSVKPVVVILDYIQMAWAKEKESRYESLSRFVTQMKELALKYDFICVVCSQINRAPTHREDKRPYPSDLRGSGNLEEIADLILLLYWPYQDDRTQSCSDFEIAVMKNRHGPIDTVRVLFRPEFYYFEEAGD